MITCDKCAFCSEIQGGSLYCARTDHFIPSIGCEDGQSRTEFVTNADRIRAMTDEELAEWLCDQIVDRNIGVPPETWLEWLKQEVDNG